MIKIIKRGAKIIKECVNCGCIFSYEKEDIKNVIEPGRYESKYVKCPQCSFVVILETTEVSPFCENCENLQTIDGRINCYECKNLSNWVPTPEYLKKEEENCWRCKEYNKDFGVCSLTNLPIDVAENALCSEYHGRHKEE